MKKIVLVTLILSSILNITNAASPIYIATKIAAKSWIGIEYIILIIIWALIIFIVIKYIIYVFFNIHKKIATKYSKIIIYICEKNFISKTRRLEYGMIERIFSTLINWIDYSYMDNYLIIIKQTKEIVLELYDIEDEISPKDIAKTLTYVYFWYYNWEPQDTWDLKLIDSVIDKYFDEYQPITPDNIQKDDQLLNKEIDFDKKTIRIVISVIFIWILLMWICSR